MQVNNFRASSYSYIRIGDDNAQNKNDTHSTQKERSGETKNLNKLSAEQKEEVKKLQARDAEVKAHEAAHQAAGGGLAGGASFDYQRGPDGKMYAVGGEVPITLKKGSTPQENLSIARRIRAAATAPTNPSAQDYAVASSATMMELKAQQEIIKEKMQEMKGQKTYAALAHA